MDLNKRNILDLLRRRSGAEFLDLGCDDGEWSITCANSIGTEKITGVDIVDTRLALAAARGVKSIKADLNARLPIPSDSYDLVHANQVIEHVADVDIFASEIARVLKPGGYAVISTENAASWCNVFACAMGWQMFSLTNLSSIRSGIGNPLAIHRGESVELSSWTHKTIFSYMGLIEFFEAHGLEVKQILGAGYFPLPSILGKLDVRHAHFITIQLLKH
ncbi:MAG: methyltransferase domain-containing protein [Candidatus Lambdaproteobacteria bacterium]|nr:methyltransferase domain-containing protein [Candidatus Lambdaproteobacteria bacterium]